METVNHSVIDTISEVIDLVGVAIIALGAAGGIILFLRDLGLQQLRTSEAYENLRRFLGRSLLLGLEFLVAGDIIKTVTTEPTLNSALALGVIVIIRTILSLSIDVEIDGRWPWQGERQQFAERVLTEPATNDVPGERHRER